MGLIDRELFAEACTAAMLDPARELFDSWRPQIVVREPCEYATAVLARRHRIPQIQIAISQSAIEHDVLNRVEQTLEHHQVGVTDAIRRAPYLTPFPASLDPSPWDVTRRFRHLPSEHPPVDDWPLPPPDRPLVYVTFGSVLGYLREAPTVYRTALAAVADLHAHVVMTVGNATDITTLGVIPPNTRVERWISHDRILAHTAMMVCHGGSGTILGALAAGVPLVVCPLFADQTANADLITQSGTGVTVRAHSPAAGGVTTLGPDDIDALRQAIDTVLHQPRYRRSARQLADEIEQAPTLNATLADLTPHRRARVPPCDGR